MIYLKQVNENYDKTYPHDNPQLYELDKENAPELNDTILLEDWSLINMMVITQILPSLVKSAVPNYSVWRLRNSTQLFVFLTTIASSAEDM